MNGRHWVPAALCALSWAAAGTADDWRGVYVAADTCPNSTRAIVVWGDYQRWSVVAVQVEMQPRFEVRLPKGSTPADGSPPLKQLFCRSFNAPPADKDVVFEKLHLPRSVPGSEPALLRVKKAAEAGRNVYQLFLEPVPGG